ncbi:hypothetical protein M9458_032642, partial [Cirrhinus mrigala]
GGQLPISSLEGSSKVLIGGSGGQGAGLPSSLFLNHSSLLPMAAGTGMGLGGSALAKTSFPPCLFLLFRRIATQPTLDRRGENR